MDRLCRCRICAFPQCRATFYVCVSCYRGQRYCGPECRAIVRRQQLLAAGKRYQQSESGRRAHRERQRLYRDTPLSIEEEIPWKCRRLVIGTGTGALPVMPEVKLEAKRREIKLLILPTKQAIQELKQNPDGTNAILHVTC